MTIGIFGGSFNPPHLGHLIVMESVRDQMRFDAMLLIPSARPPNKSPEGIAPPGDRLAMTRLAVQGDAHYEVSDIEIGRTGLSYTVDTLAELRRTRPGARLVLIIGADNLAEFPTWKSPDEIVAQADLLVMTRPGFHDAKNEYARLARFVNVPQIGISGTDIRRRVKMGRSIRWLVPPNVEEYIRRHRLYRD